MLKKIAQAEGRDGWTITTRKFNALFIWIAGKANFDAGLFRMMLGVDGGSCVSYDEFVGLEATRRLASSPPVW